jgi:flagellar hook-associated protein 1 FlgK
MSSIALNTGLRALLSAQFVLDTIGHNIANANTPGYSRQRVQLGTSLPLPSRGLLVGSGVDANSVQRSVDALLGRRLLGQISTAGGLTAQLGGMTEIETLINEPDGTGLGSSLAGFFSSISNLTTAPDDLILRTGVVQGAVSLTTQFNQLASGLANVVRDTQAEIEVRVAEANQLASQIAELNIQIGETEATGVPANDLSDARDLAVKRLAEILEIDTLEGPNGSVRVLIEGNTLVSSDRANAISITREHRSCAADRGLDGFRSRPRRLDRRLDAPVPGLRAQPAQRARSLGQELDPRSQPRAFDGIALQRTEHLAGR